VKLKYFVVATLLVVGASCGARQPGAPINPGFNVYSKDQDVQLGRQAAAEIRQQVDVVQDGELQSYVKSLGQQLARTPSAGDYPYEFTLINDPTINAFALPGGPIFVNSGLIRAAANEGQVAGVLAHEIAHVALRHGTNQASKASLMQIPAAAAQVLLGDGGALGQVAQMGAGLGLNLLMLKYSRSAEEQADALGAKILHEAGYNPVEMARFFETLEKESGGGGPQFLASHPNPGNRVKAVQAELQTFPQKQYTAASSGNFNSARQRVAGLPEPRKSVKEAMAAAAAPRQAPQAATGSGARTLQTQRFQMSVPSNWVAYGDKTGNSVVAGPRNGLVPDGRGQVQIGYGVLMGHYRPRRGNNLQAGARELVNALRSSDPSLRVGGFQRAQVNGRQALMAEMQGASPLGGAESNLLVAVPQGNGMMYLVFAAPQRDWAGLESAARQMLGTLQVAQ
jgi:hypothetical protein